MGISKIAYAIGATSVAGALSVTTPVCATVHQCPVGFGVGLLQVDSAVMEDLSDGDGPPKYYRLKLSTNVDFVERAALRIDKLGVATFYPQVPERNHEPLGLTFRELDTAFGLQSEEKKSHRTVWFSGWNGQRWNDFRLDLKFKNGHCTQYRVTGPGVQQAGWHKEKKKAGET